MTHSSGVQIDGSRSPKLEITGLWSSRTPASSVVIALELNYWPLVLPSWPDAYYKNYLKALCSKFLPGTFGWLHPHSSIDGLSCIVPTLHRLILISGSGESLVPSPQQDFFLSLFFLKKDYLMGRYLTTVFKWVCMHECVLTCRALCFDKYRKFPTESCDFFPQLWLKQWCGLFRFWLIFRWAPC